MNHKQHLIASSSKDHSSIPKVVDQPAVTILHWHAHAVTSILSSHDGRFVYSGGDEGVLVLWHVGSGGLNKKTFIPRLGAAVADIQER